MRAHAGLNPEVVQQFYSFSQLAGQRANRMIFSNLSAFNIVYNSLGQAVDIVIIEIEFR